MLARRTQHVAALSAALAAASLAWLPTAVALPWPSSLAIGLEVQLFVMAVVLGALRYGWAATLVLLVSPVHVRFWQGFDRYAHGNAYYFVARRCFRQADGNLDDEFRVPVICRGLTDSSLEWMLWSAPQNAALELSVKFFGPMPGAYDGPLPSSLEFREAISTSSVSMTLLEVQRTPIRVGARLVGVRPDLGPKMIQVALGATPDDACLSTMVAKVAMWRDRVLMVALPWDKSCISDGVMKDWFSFGAAVDAQSGKVLGYYELDSRLGTDAVGLAGVWNSKRYDCAGD